MNDRKIISERLEFEPALISKEQNLSIRETEFSKISKHMIVLNSGLLCFLAALVIFESWSVWMAHMDASERIVDAKVLIALITAITVQVGTIALTGSKWFFRA